MTRETIQLTAPDARGLTATFAPDANLILHSLTLDGRELLATLNGLEDYVENGSTMGVPLLHPWANRLSGHGYTAADTAVELDRDSALFKRDPAGLPIHGALPGLSRWRVLDVATHADTAWLVAWLDWSPSHPAFELFPFPHMLEYRARVEAATVEIAVALEPTSDAPVPVSFGFHPYLRIPGGTRANANMSLPVRRLLVHDESMIPTGETAPCEPGLRQLGDSAWDDGFTDLTDPARFVLGGDDSEVTLTFLRGYPFAQVFAPPRADFVCFEPMTAPTNALAAGGPDLPVVKPGGRYDAAFEIAVR
jgi:aldose 1-epimerase